jgi:DeoR family glycerol-3-phosphate regulon repressor
VGVSQTLLAQSRRVVLVADHSKLQRHAPVRVASLEEVGTFVTDRPLPPALAARCRDWGTEVVVASG